MIATLVQSLQAFFMFPSEWAAQTEPSQSGQHRTGRTRAICRTTQTASPTSPRSGVQPQLQNCLLMLLLPLVLPC